MLLTVLGARGFIGSHLVQKLNQLQVDTLAPERGEELRGRQLGHIIYCIGLSSDFRQRPLDTVEAHVCKLLDVLRHCDFESLLYVSSTRIYSSTGPAHEDDTVRLQPANPDHLYDASKVLGESLALASGKMVRIARLSNVYGPDFHSGNFLATILRDAIKNRKIVLRTALDSEKDYIHVGDATDLVIEIATKGRAVIYNCASGTNTSNEVLCSRIRELTGCEIEVEPNAPRVVFPPVNIDRVKEEFDFQPARLVDRLEQLVQTYRAQLGG